MPQEASGRLALLPYPHPYIADEEQGRIFHAHVVGIPLGRVSSTLLPRSGAVPAFLSVAADKE